MCGGEGQPAAIDGGVSVSMTVASEKAESSCACRASSCENWASCEDSLPSAAKTWSDSAAAWSYEVKFDSA